MFYLISQISKLTSTIIENKQKLQAFSQSIYIAAYFESFLPTMMKADAKNGPAIDSRKPHDTGKEDDGNSPMSKNKLHGSGHFGKQLMESVLEDKSNHFPISGARKFVEFAEDEEEAKVDGGDPKPKYVKGSSFRVKPSPMSNKGSIADVYDLCSISTMGNGSHFPNFGDKVEDKQVTFEDNIVMEQPWVIKQTPNEPHYLTEFPPLYWMFKHFPGTLESIKKMYQFRWSVSYPLQRRVFLSQQLRKLGIFCTYGELLMVLGIVWMTVAGVLTTFVWPSPSLRGHAARTPLILALATAMRNSLITLLIGLPFERALWYHKLLGRLAFFNGILHTIVCHADSLQKVFFKFLVLDQMNASGTGLFMLIAGVTVTSVPQVRNWCFEFFYYVHIGFVVLMTACAFYHSGILIPILASIVWGGDLFCCKIVMACCRYPRTARLRVISETVVELSFPKTATFDYSPLQHVSIAVPELSMMEWHPFSIASSPRQPNVTLLIRDCGPGTWTNSLFKLAKEKSEVSVLIEGPNGSPNIDVFSNSYKSYLMFSGGIGITVRIPLPFAWLFPLEIYLMLIHFMTFLLQHSRAKP